MSSEIIIRKAEIKDLESFYALHSYWIEKGEIKQTFSIKQLERIILESEVTVAVANNKVVSYYFINPFYETGNVSERKTIVENLIKKGILNDGKYAYSLQSATHKDHFGKGLNRSVLNLLREISKEKYDYFIGIMAYTNIATQESSLKMGWKHYGDVGIGLLAVIETLN